MTGCAYILIGASGHAKVVLDCVRSRGGYVRLFVDFPEKGDSFQGCPIVWPYSHELHDCEALVTIGDNRTRKRLVGEMKPYFGRISHASAIISESVEWGEGTVVIHRAVVQADTRIGRHCIINTAASVDHDCVIGDYVHVGPNCGICGGVHIGEGSLLGVGCSVIPGVSIGRWCTIGAGSVIVRDVPDGATVVGNPAGMPGRAIRERKESD